MEEKEESEELDPMILSKLLAEIRRLNEILEDYRIMIAPWLGYKVVDKEK